LNGEKERGEGGERVGERDGENERARTSERVRASEWEGGKSESKRVRE